MIDVDMLSMSLADTLVASRKKINGTAFKVAILRQSTLEPITPYAIVACQSFGVNLEIVWGGFDTMLQDTFSADLPLEDVDAILICPSVERAAPEILNMIAKGQGNNSDISTMISDRLFSVIKNIQKRTAAPIILSGLSFNSYLSGYVNQNTIHTSIFEINKTIRSSCEQEVGINFLDMDSLIAFAGGESFYDPLRNYRMGVPFSDRGFRLLAAELAVFIRNFSGKIKKVLVLDCDNTLWGGLCGEVSDPNELELGETNFPAAAFRDIQRWALELKQRGVLLVLASKNDEVNVWKTFDKNTSMLLSKSDITTWRINWLPKAENIRAMAAELNLNLDSFVFLDDQPLEIDSVKRLCPDVTCLLLNEESLLKVRSIGRRAGWFEVLNITEADKIRADYFTAEAERKHSLENSIDFNDYLENLLMEATIRFDDKVNLTRAEQMCARTNQMNLTTIRHTKSKINEFVDASNVRVISIDISDRLGQLGDISLGIMEFDQDNDECKVDTFVLSCRAFSRNVEELMFSTFVKEASRLGAKTLRAIYSRTAKNTLAMPLLEKMGFEIESKTDETIVGILRVDAWVQQDISVFNKINYLRK